METPFPGFWLWLPGAYLLGSLPTGYLLGRAIKGIDIREHGSGNPGATNVFRVVGKAAGIFTLIVDAAKGYLPVQLALLAQPRMQWPAAAVGLAAIAGHNWSLFLNFRGGKGVATSAGVFLALIPAPTCIAFGFFLAGLFATGHVSVGSMLGAAGLCVGAWFLTASVFLTSLSVFCALLVLFLHRKNIRRLLQREEPKIIGGDRGP